MPLNLLADSNTHPVRHTNTTLNSTAEFQVQSKAEIVLKYHGPGRKGHATMPFWSKRTSTFRIPKVDPASGPVRGEWRGTLGGSYTTVVNGTVTAVGGHCGHLRLTLAQLAAVSTGKSKL